MWQGGAAGGASSKRYTARFEVTTTTPGVGPFVLFASGEQRRGGIRPRLAIEPAGGIGFGSVAQGASREETVFLRSVGQSALLVEGVTLMSDTGDFTIIGVPPTVPQTFPAGKSLSLTVRFAPKRGGSSLQPFASRATIRRASVNSRCTAVEGTWPR